jgi:hypothetical protein
MGEGTDTAAPPVDDEAPTPPPTADVKKPSMSIPLEAAFPEILRLKVVGSILFIVAGATAVLPAFLVGPGMGSPVTLVALALAAAGTAVSTAGLLAPGARRVAMLLGPGLLVAAVAANPIGATLDRITLEELLFAFIFAVTWLLGVEHMHAVLRFVELGAYVARQRLTTFRLSSVVNHFQLYGMGMVALILLVSVIVVVGVPWVFAQGGSETFGRSSELSSVFGIGIAAAVVFTLSAMILVFLRSVIPHRVDVERVAYSRDRIDDMLRGSQVMEAAEGSRGREDGRS